MYKIDPVLYPDPQAKPPQGYCPICGGECWLPSLLCLRCERRGL